MNTTLHIRSLSPLGAALVGVASLVSGTLAPAQSLNPGAFPGFTPANVVFDVAGTSSNQLMACGIDSVGGVLLEAWNGSSWTSTASAGFTGAYPYCMASRSFANGQPLRVVAGTFAGEVFEFTGASWTQIGALFGGAQTTDVVVAPPPVFGLPATTNVFAAGVPTTGACVLEWNGSTWSAPGGGLTGQAICMDFSSANGLLVVGDLTLPSTGSAKVARLDPTTGNWVALPDPMPGATPSVVRRMPQTNNPVVFASDPLGNAGIFEFDGTNWVTLANSISGGVLAMTVANTKLLALGSLSSVQGVAVSGAAVWDGASWAPLSSFNTPVYGATDFLVDQTVVVGGEFMVVGGGFLPNVASFGPSVPGLISTAGAGCAQPSGLPNLLIPFNTPLIGQSYLAGAINQVPNPTIPGTPGGLTLQIRDQVWTGPVPLSIVWPGSSPSCFVYTGSSIVDFLPTTTPFALAGFPIPPSLALVGGQLFHQVVNLIDPAGSGITMATSSQVYQLTIGVY